MSNSNVIEEHDYIARTELNMPTAFLDKTTPRLTREGAIRQRETFKFSKNLYNSEKQLLANNRKLYGDIYFICSTFFLNCSYCM